MNETKCTEPDSTPMSYESTGNTVDVITEDIRKERKRFRINKVVRNINLVEIRRTVLKFDRSVSRRDFVRKVRSNPDAFHDIVKYRPSFGVSIPVRPGVYPWEASSVKQAPAERAITELTLAKAVSGLAQRAAGLARVSESSGQSGAEGTEDKSEERVIKDNNKLSDESLQLQNRHLAFEATCIASQAQHAVEAAQDVLQDSLQIDSVYWDSVVNSERSDNSGLISPSAEVFELVSVAKTQTSTTGESESGQQNQLTVGIDSAVQGSRPLLQETSEGLNSLLAIQETERVEKSSTSVSVPVTHAVTFHFKDEAKQKLYGFFFRPSTFDTYAEYQLSCYPESIRNEMAKNMRATPRSLCQNCGAQKLQPSSCNHCQKLSPTDKKKRSAEDLNKSKDRSPWGKSTKKSKMNGEESQTGVAVNTEKTVVASNVSQDRKETVNARQLIAKEVKDDSKSLTTVKLKCTSVHFGTYIVDACSDVTITKLDVQFAVMLKDGSTADIVISNDSILRSMYYAPEGIILIRTGRQWSTWVRKRFGLPKKKEAQGDPWFDSSSSDTKEQNVIFRFKSLPQTSVKKIQDNKLLGHESWAVAPGDAPRLFGVIGVTLERSGDKNAVWKASVAPVTAESCKSPGTTSVQTPLKRGMSPKSKLVATKAKSVRVNSSQNPASTTPVQPSETTRNNVMSSALKSVGRTEESPSGPMQKVAIHLPEPNREILQRGTFKLLKRDILTVCPEQLLNDTMIDFWLDHFWKNVLNEEDRQRSHIFSTFFYSRLTQKDNSTGNSHGKTEAEKRHSRVNRWTRKVDIFSKDFVIVPINEACHWYVAIICFPGLECPEWLKDSSPISGWTNVVVSDGQPNYRTAPGMPERTDDLPLALKYRLKTNGPELTCNADEVKNTDHNQPEGTETSKEGSSSPGQSDVSKDKKIPLSPSKASSTEGNATTSNRPKLNGALKDMNISKSDYDYEQRDEAAGDPDEEILYTKYAYDDWDVAGGPLEGTQDEKIKTEVKTEGSLCVTDFNIRQPCIIIFDSLGGDSHTKVLATLREYLQEEYKIRKNKTKVFDKFTMPGLTVNCPQQQNFYDCGVYVLEYVEKLFNCPLSSYLLPLPYTLRNWFGQLDGKRKEIYDTIQALVRETKPENIGHLPPFEVPMTTTIPSSNAEARTPNSVAPRTVLATPTGSQVLLSTGKITYKLLSSSTQPSSMCTPVTKPQLQPRTKLMPTPRTPKKQVVTPMPTTPVPEAGAFETTPDLKEDKSPIGILSDGIQNTVVISEERSSVLSPPPEVQTVANPEATDNPQDIVNIDHNYMSSSESSSQQSTQLAKQKRGKVTPTSRPPSSRRKSKTNQEEQIPSAENTPVTKPKSPASRKRKTRTPSSNTSPRADPDGLDRLPFVLGTETLKLQSVEPEAEPMDVDIQ